MGKVAGEVGGSIWIPLVFALFLAMLTASSYAKLVTKHPKAGGAAVFAERAFKIPLTATPAALVFLLLVALLNARGVKESVRANVVMTVIEVSGLVRVIVLVGIMFGRGDGMRPASWSSIPRSPPPWEFWQPRYWRTTRL